MGKPTIADAELCLKLYELRTEETLRRARKFVAFEFWPENLTDLQKVIFAFDTDHNHYWRQVMSYWEMAAGFVNNDALNEDVFAASASELFFVFAKYKHFIPQMRELNPAFMANMEEFINRSKENQERVERVLQGPVKLVKAKMAGK
jgi:hypothetical protein